MGHSLSLAFPILAFNFFIIVAHRISNVSSSYTFVKKKKREIGSFGEEEQMKDFLQEKNLDIRCWNYLNEKKNQNHAKCMSKLKSAMRQYEKKEQILCVELSYIFREL